jgi:hypothetical protein
MYIWKVGLTLHPLKTRFRPQNQSSKITYLTHVIKSSIGCSPMVSIGSAKKTCVDHGVSTTCVSFSTIFGVLKTSKAW